MRVPFHLQKRAVVEPPVAYLLFSGAPADVVEVCAQLAHAPAIFPLADGFLLIPREPVGVHPAQTIGLRRLGENLYLPCDADLLPALLDDEVAGLTRRRGLVFLPGNRVLAFDPGSPLPPDKLLTVRRAPPRSWQTLPQARVLPERIRRLERAMPPLEQIIDAGGEGIGEEPPTPDSAGAGSTLLGGATAGIGKGMMWLGNQLGWKGLAGAGAKWIADAVLRAPRLSESILGKQEAALRALLNDFRNGNLDKALRRALPIGGDGGRGGMAATGAQLPLHNLRFSLSDLLGHGGSPASVWFGGGDVQQQLVDEYRKAARQAEAHGDFRRAAFIFGKLLFDYRSAADALKRGGLYREAAVLYLEKLNDPRSAAQAFEAAGETDRAVQLYRQLGDHVRAGELLKGVGEDEAALAEFQTAASNLVRSRQAYLEAGEVMLFKAERVDLALGYFEAGWQLRNTAGSTACLFHLARLYVQVQRCDALLTLVSVAEEEFTARPADASAAQFFDLVATLADDPKAATLRPELRDRARMGLARRMRQHIEIETRPGKTVSNLFGKNPSWPAPLVSDADFALKAALRKSGSRPAGRLMQVRTVRVGEGLVTAVGQAAVEGTVFLGFSDGKVFAFHPTTGAVISVDSLLGGVSSIAVDSEGQLLIVQRETPDTERPDRHILFLHSYVRSRSNDYVFSTSRTYSTDGQAWLMPMVGNTERYSGWWKGGVFELLRGAAVTVDLSINVPDQDCRGGFLIHGGDYPAEILFGGSWVGCLDPGKEPSPLRSAPLFWTPDRPEGNPLRTIPLSHHEYGEGLVEVAGLDSKGCLHYSQISFSGLDPQVNVTNTAVRPEGYLATTIVGPGEVAGVSRSHIDWLRAGKREFTRKSTTMVALRSAIACFVSFRTSELLVVCAEGEVARVPFPALV
jgi:tetratricopeptide (TPR) repeat protein